jgi:hypothetical protein
MPLGQWLPQLRATLLQNRMPNLVIEKLGCGVEVVGVTQAIADLMIQSVTPVDGSGDSFVTLFPITEGLTSMAFSRRNYTSDP